MKKKSFKYQITVKFLLKKYNLDGETEFKPVFFFNFNSVTKTVKKSTISIRKFFSRNFILD